MAESTTATASKPKPKGIQRLQIGLNVLIQLVLIFFLVSAVNWFGFRHYKRWDVSRDQEYALSDKTKRFLNSVKGKIRITVFFSPNTPISGDVASLLTEYQYAAKGKIDIENIDPQRNLSRATRGQARHALWPATLRHKALHRRRRSTCSGPSTWRRSQCSKSGIRNRRE